jgi:hypothetical protein
MSPRKRYSFFLDDDHAAGLKALKERDGISEAEAVRRAVTEFLERKHIKVERKRARSRKRS